MVSSACASSDASVASPYPLLADTAKAMEGEIRSMPAPSRAHMMDCLKEAWARVRMRKGWDVFALSPVQREGVKGVGAVRWKSTCTS